MESFLQLEHVFLLEAKHRVAMVLHCSGNQPEKQRSGFGMYGYNHVSRLTRRLT